MLLEAVIFPHDFHTYGYKDLYGLEGGWGYEVEDEKGGTMQCGMVSALDQVIEQKRGLDGFQGNWDSSSSSAVQNFKECETNSSPEACDGDGFFPGNFSSAVVQTERRKRRRTKSCKNKEEVENQRMAHIAVERNRRKQMNEYLAILRSLMPPSYAQRGDQASIIGGAINFVKELEQLLQSLEVQKRMKQGSDVTRNTCPFTDFFTFPQYTSCSTHQNSNSEVSVEKRSAIADIEVTMVESHANLKILSKGRPKQLLKMVAAFQNLRLTILHLNVTTVDQMVLYSFSVKVEEDCQLTSVDEIATAVYQMLGRIQQDSNLN